MGKSWDESDFIALAQQHFGNGFPTGSMLPNIQVFAQEAFDHYEDATAEGKAYLDAWLQKFYELLAIKLEGAPDGAGTRKMKRLVALGRKKHFEAKKFIEYFPTILDKEPPLVEEALLILSKTLQCLFDILHDAIQDSQDGPAKIAVLGGERAAALYSLLGSAKLNGLDPELYLHHVLTRIADHPINSLDELLPWNVSIDPPVAPTQS